MNTLTKYFPHLVVALAGLMLVARAMPPRAKEGRKDLYAFGSIPVQHGGRTQPLDSLARNSLVVISGKQEYEDPRTGKTTPAIDWLLTVGARPDVARD
jgi:hypothetical protein